MFGHSLSPRKSKTRGPPGIGFKLSSDGNFDVENKRICNLANPTGQTDAVNLLTLKHTVEERTKALEKSFREEINQFKKEVSNWLVIFKSEVEKSFNSEGTGYFQEIINEPNLAEHLNEQREELRKDLQKWK